MKTLLNAFCKMNQTALLLIVLSGGGLISCSPGGAQRINTSDGSPSPNKPKKGCPQLEEFQDTSVTGQALYQRTVGCLKNRLPEGLYKGTLSNNQPCKVNVQYEKGVTVKLTGGDKALNISFLLKDKKPSILKNALFGPWRTFVFTTERRTNGQKTFRLHRQLSVKNNENGVQSIYLYEKKQPAQKQKTPSHAACFLKR